MNNNKKFQKKQNKVNNKQKQVSTLIVGAPRSLGTLGIPSEMMVDFVYNDPTISRLSGTTYSYYLIRLGGLYDPDPNLGSGTISTFPEYAKLYNYYQVQSVKVEWSVLNAEAVPKTCYFYVTHAATYPAAFSDAVNFAELSNSSATQTIGMNTGGNALAKFEGTIRLSDVYGGITYRTNPNFYSVTSAVPSSNIVMCMVAYSAATMAIGVYSNLRVTYRTRLWERGNAIA